MSRFQIRVIRVAQFQFRVTCAPVDPFKYYRPQPPVLAASAPRSVRTDLVTVGWILRAPGRHDGPCRGSPSSTRSPSPSPAECPPQRTPETNRQKLRAPERPDTQPGTRARPQAR